MGTETCHIPVARYYSLSSWFFLLIGYRQDICQFSYTQRHSDIFQAELNVTEEKKTYGSILKSVRFCFKTREEAES